MKKTAIVNCTQVVTPRGEELVVIPHGSLLVADGRVQGVGPQREIERTIDGSWEVIDADGRLLLPGFVDAHTHPVFAGNRADEFERRCAGATYQEIAAAGGGILSTVRQTRAATEEDLIGQSLKYSEWFLRCGTTTIEAKSGYGLSFEDELKILRVIRGSNTRSPLRRVPTFLGAHAIPGEYKGRTEDYVHLVIREMIPAVADEGLAEYCDVFAEPGIFNIDQARRIMLAARRHGLKLRIHADQLTRSGGAELAAEVGAVTADHLEHTDAAGIAALKAAVVQPVLLPGSVATLGSRQWPDARAMLDAGLAVVLATDFNPGTSPTPSVPLVLWLACTQMKMTPAEAILAATIHAARSLGREDEIGSLEPGKHADFVLFDCSDYRELIYFFGMETAHAVYIDGERVVERTLAVQPGGPAGVMNKC
jgi:imidazolonepropionase